MNGDIMEFKASLSGPNIQSQPADIRDLGNLLTQLVAQAKCNPLAEGIRELRREILSEPRLLTGNPEPPIQLVWAYARALNDALDIVLGRDPSLWATYVFRKRRVGGRGELEYVRRSGASFSQQLQCLTELHEGFDAWVESGCIILGVADTDPVQRLFLDG